MKPITNHLGDVFQLGEFVTIIYGGKEIVGEITAENYRDGFIVASDDKDLFGVDEKKHSLSVPGKVYKMSRHFQYGTPYTFDCILKLPVPISVELSFQIY